MPACKNCSHNRRLFCRGLCRPCYEVPTVRYRFPDLRSANHAAGAGDVLCANCGKLRARNGYRGLCPMCYRDQAVRERRPDKRVVPLSPDYERRNAILTDPELCPVRYLENWAKRTRFLFGESYRIDTDDLVQTAWLVLVRAADSWRPGGKAKTLVGFAGDIIRKEMKRTAKRAIRTATFGDSELSDSGRGFRVAQWQHVGENTDLVRTLLVVDDHAVRRYRERIRAGATVGEIRRAVAKAKLAPDWVGVAATAGGTRFMKGVTRDGDVYAVRGEAVFIIGTARDERPLVRTVLTMTMLRESAALSGIETRP